MKRILEFIEMMTLAIGVPFLIFIAGPLAFGLVIGILAGVR